ncbi:MAG: sulfatase-like hydrolase/transferase [Rhabdochlamydiaceae bacterium]|jgi:glucan phosphoethanolaminetransferase (alkaline phosphatase superfamily)
MHEHRHVNYVYFAVLFVFIAFLHICQVFIIETDSTLDRLFYITYALCQCFLEVGILIFFGKFLIKKFPKSLSPLFIILTFLLLVLHAIDFPLVRIMDWSIWYVLDFVAAESFENLLEMLYASNVSLKTWMMVGVFILLSSALGLVFFRFTELVAKKRPLNFSYRKIAITLLTITVFLVAFDLKTGKDVSHAGKEKFVKALPWKATLFSNDYPMMVVKNRLKSPPKEKVVLAKLNQIALPTVRKPNIFLFVIESLRADFVTKEIAPAITHFREKNTAFPDAFSSANGTHPAWFSIFHGRYPFYWEKMQPPFWKEGSIPLSILKKMGYKIHLYSSARLSYYQMDEILFGEDKHLADSMNLFYRDDTGEPWESDAQCFQKLESDIESWKNEEGHIFLTFLDGTHFDYSWPKVDKLKFEPIVDQIDYLKVSYSKEDLESIKNRYRNAIFYIDSLFDSFVTKLDQLQMGEEAIVVVTADHGEEFFEEGNIFHASHLSSMQTQVPLYYRFGKGLKPVLPLQTSFTSHVDIFPSILDYVCKENLFADWFDGESIFRDKKRAFVITARYNASRAPYEFFIHNGKSKITARFMNQKNIYKSNVLQVISKKDSKDRNMPFEIDLITQEFGDAFEHLFSKK